MKCIEFYKSVLKLSTDEEVFEFLTSNLKPSNMTWSYFVNWEKVFKNTKKLELGLNNLNYLIGKSNFDDEFRFLIKENPNVVQIIPALAARGNKGSSRFEILVDYKNKKLSYKNFDFLKKEHTEEDIENILFFVKNTGIKSLLIDKKIKNLVDYVIGVETGLDSNARKNRSGHIMEDIVEAFIKDICQKNNFFYLKEANAKKIEKEFKHKVPVDKSSRRYDFVINNGKELFIIETNFYVGGGSKLKSTAGEYKSLFDFLKGKYKFFWITDGRGWVTTKKPLRETFDHNDYIFNLSMLEQGILESLIK